MCIRDSCHSTGTRAHTEGLANYHNAFASIYEGRYLAGIVAGMKLNEMIANGEITEDEAKMGYVGAYTYAEVDVYKRQSTTSSSAWTPPTCATCAA